MSDAKEICQLTDCMRIASVLCYCCQQSICTRHFTEHIDAVNKQVHPLADTINTMVEKIENLMIEQLTETSFVKINQWKCDMHQLIDQIYLDKHQEIEDLMEKNKEKFVEHKTQLLENAMKIQEEVKQLLEDGDATAQQIESLRNQLARIEENQMKFQKNFLSVDTQVSGHDLVTVSSTLATFLLSSNVPSPQLSIPSNFPTFNAPLFGGGQTTTVFGGFAPPSSAFTLDNPYAVTDNPPTRRLNIRARRR